MSIRRLICIMSIFCLPTLSWGLSLHCGPNREPYDPAREGCCKKPDGTYEVTDNKEYVNVCSLSEVQEDSCKRSFGYYKACLPYGVTICYNGEKYSCICACKGVQNTELAMCILAHEEKHVRDDNWKCTDCDAKMPEPQDQTKADQDHCTMYKEDIACAKSISGWEDNPEIMAFINDISSNLAFCP